MITAAQSTLAGVGTKSKGAAGGKGVLLLLFYRSLQSAEQLMAMDEDELSSPLSCSNGRKVANNVLS